MRQVSKSNYLIIGAGRMARHFSHYLNLLGIPHQQWSRRSDPKQTTLARSIANNKCILILISDAAIEDFIQANPALRNKTLIHFSGCLTTPRAYGAHPLMTFGMELHDLKVYQKISFILEQGGPPFAELFPRLNNPHFFIPRNLKPFYHVLCVLSGNFTCLLWQKVFSEFEKKLHISKEALYPYLERTLHNLRSHSEQALTGPLVRSDNKTIAENLQALDGDPFQKIYQIFVEVYQNEHQ
jgi:predicted short-subunit dehydrogenase-like oxidoreductase (DUF2520 family)